MRPEADAFACVFRGCILTGRLLGLCLLRKLRVPDRPSSNPVLCTLSRSAGGNIEEPVRGPLLFASIRALINQANSFPARRGFRQPLV